MNHLEKQYDWNNNNLVSQYDELSLWSSYFGHLLLNNIPLQKYRRYLDIGCGTGFPLIEVCQKAGTECAGYGIDPWEKALERIKQKVATLDLRNIELIKGSAGSMPFGDGYFDLITSNLGINNFSEPEKVISECYRVLKKQGVLCITSNLCGTFKEFYEIFQKTLVDLGLQRYSTKLENHIKHRGTCSTVSSMFQSGGFLIGKCIESSFFMRFLDGSAFLNHSVISSGFLPAWRKIFTKEEEEQFFVHLEQNLNEYSKENGEFKVGVPMLYMECRK